MKVEIFTDYTPGKPTQGSVTIPYQGYEISVSSFGRDGEVAVFTSRKDHTALQTFYGATAESIQKAFVYVDALKKTSGYRSPVVSDACDLLDIAEYLEMAKVGSIIDYDGHGHPVNAEKMEDPNIFINP